MDHFCFWTNQPPQAPLTIFASANFGHAKVLLDSIRNTVGNLKTIKTNSHRAYCAGRQQTIAQEKKTTVLCQTQV
jgi:hypothetical protein